MKIKTRLKLNTLFSLGAIVLIMLSLAWSFWEILRTDRNEEIVSSLRKISFERILLRDEYKCQYCGSEFASEDLTFEHVVPRASGGQTVWENILTACIPCNARKGAQHVNWSARKGMRPFKPPRGLPSAPGSPTVLVQEHIPRKGGFPYASL